VLDLTKNIKIVVYFLSLALPLTRSATAESSVWKKKKEF